MKFSQVSFIVYTLHRIKTINRSKTQRYTSSLKSSMNFGQNIYRKVQQTQVIIFIKKFDNKVDAMPRF